jgi:hypothetical protein
LEEIKSNKTILQQRKYLVCLAAPSTIKSTMTHSCKWYIMTQVIRQATFLWTTNHIRFGNSAFLKKNKKGSDLAE